MKYKLINKQTGVETLCDKVTIDGFDYYVSDEKPIINDYCIDTYSKLLTRCNKTNYGSNSYDFFKKVIATNNPTIDIPKVVDEVDFAFDNYQKLPNEFKGGITQWTNGFHFGYNKSQETHPFSEEDMIEFYEWCNYPIYRADGELGFRSRVQAQFPEYNTYVVIDETGYSIHPKGVFLTTEELLQLWKDQKPKTVYCS